MYATSGAGTRIRLWFDGSANAGSTGIGWWAEAAPAGESEPSTWFPICAACRPGQGRTADDAEMEAAQECIILLRTLHADPEAWATPH